MEDRSAQTVSPVAFMALAVMVSIGSIGDASAGPLLVYRTQRDVLGSDTQRDPVAQWLSSLTQAARQAHGQTQAVLPTGCVHPESVTVSSRAVLPCPWAPVHPLSRVLPTLIDLPPPVA